MPSWGIHIEIGKRLNKQLKYIEEEKQQFLLGNILPDINNCYVIKNISEKYSHTYTHYNDDENDNYTYMSFYKKYKQNLNNPLILGYFVHLYTDYIWNKDFLLKSKDRITKKLSKEELRIIKQTDFRSYNDIYSNNKIKIKDFNSIIDNVIKLKRISLTEEDLKEVLKYQQKAHNSNLKLQFYTKEELDNLMEKTIEKITNFLLNKKEV